MAVIKKPGLANSGGGATIAFPDVCKTPAPPAPFVPVPYPNVQFQENLKEANRVDAQASTGNKKAITLQKEAINNLRKSTGDEAGTLKGIVSASTAVKVGYTLHKSGLGQPTVSTETSVSMGLSNHATPTKTR